MNLLKQYRKKNNYNFQTMANMLNISKTYYWQIENNQRRLSYLMAIKIARIFDLKPDDLFYREKLENLILLEKKNKS